MSKKEEPLSLSDTLKLRIQQAKDMKPKDPDESKSKQKD